MTPLNTSRAFDIQEQSSRNRCLKVSRKTVTAETKTAATKKTLKCPKNDIIFLLSEISSRIQNLIFRIYVYFNI